MADMQYKVGYGLKTDIENAITENLIDAGDIIFTKDSEEAAFIKEDKTPMFVQSRTKEAHTLKGVSLGALNDGSTIEAGISMDEFIQKITQKRIPATYTAPTVKITNNGGTNASAVEAGTFVNAKMIATFNKNDAGDITEIVIKKDDDQVAQSNETTCSYDGGSLVITDGSVSFKATATYAEGPIKNDNLGTQSPAGHIEAGSVDSSAYTFTGQRNLFYGSGIGTAPSPVTSDDVRGLHNKKLNPTAGYSFTMNIADGQQYIIIAYPATIRDINKVHYVEGNDPNLAKNFTKSSVQVADARGGENGQIEYKCYLYSMETPAAAAMTLNVTI